MPLRELCLIVFARYNKFFLTNIILPFILSWNIKLLCQSHHEGHCTLWGQHWERKNLLLVGYTLSKYLGSLSNCLQPLLGVSRSLERSKANPSGDGSRTFKVISSPWAFSCWVQLWINPVKLQYSRCEPFLTPLLRLVLVQLELIKAAPQIPQPFRRLCSITQNFRTCKRLGNNLCLCIYLYIYVYNDTNSTS